ncbi:MAG TPA: energy-coupling factor ABC transporter permease [Thermoplasmata archaeon]|nr:energy-coupling factor ABC transporter permease [Thermoplasmata archaeon]
MHIPDGLMWPPLLAIGWIVAIAIIAIAVRRTSGKIHVERIPTMAVLASGIFVAQMLNFPIIGGTTGHLIGATIATCMVGPWAAVIVMSVVIVMQGLMFGDGGILAMGLNLTNMAIIGVGISWLVISMMKGLRSGIAVPVAAWTAVMIAALFCAIELSVSNLAAPGTYGITWSICLPSMLGLHALIGIGEAAITSAVVTYFALVAPEILHHSAKKGREVTAE